MKQLLLIIFFQFSCTQLQANTEILKSIKLPAGFKISLFAKNLPNARSLAYGGDGIVYVSTRQAGKVYALQDRDNDGKADRYYTIAKNLNMPNGIAFANGHLFVAEVNQISRIGNINQRLKNPPKPQIIYKGLPSDRHHGWKYLRLGQDNKLYTAVGAPCNICQTDKVIYGALVRLNTDGSDFEILASGIRNSVGFDWQPETNKLFFTDNGGDNLGDDIPADELNRWDTKGQHFGYPFCHGGEILDKQFGQQGDCQKYSPPVWKFNAHVAPLGLRFYRGKQFPQSYHQQLFVAQHGSWNRSTPDGYRIVLLRFQEDKVVSKEVFAEGWLTKTGEVLGRPTDILELPDGSLLIADDYAGVIYRISY